MSTKPNNKPTEHDIEQMRQSLEKFRRTGLTAEGLDRSLKNIAERLRNSPMPRIRLSTVRRLSATTQQGLLGGILG